MRHRKLGKVLLIVFIIASTTGYSIAREISVEKTGNQDLKTIQRFTDTIQKETDSGLEKTYIYQVDEKRTVIQEKKDGSLKAVIKLEKTTLSEILSDNSKTVSEKTEKINDEKYLIEGEEFEEEDTEKLLEELEKTPVKNVKGNAKVPENKINPFKAFSVTIKDGEVVKKGNRIETKNKIKIGSNSLEISFEESNDIAPTEEYIRDLEKIPDTDLLLAAYGASDDIGGIATVYESNLSVKEEIGKDDDYLVSDLSYTEDGDGDRYFLAAGTTFGGPGLHLELFSLDENNNMVEEDHVTESSASRSGGIESIPTENLNVVGMREEGARMYKISDSVELSKTDTQDFSEDIYSVSITDDEQLFLRGSSTIYKYSISFTNKDFGSEEWTNDETDAIGMAANNERVLTGDTDSLHSISTENGSIMDSETYDSDHSVKTYEEDIGFMIETDSETAVAELVNQNLSVRETFETNYDVFRAAEYSQENNSLFLGFDNYLEKYSVEEQEEETTFFNSSKHRPENYNFWDGGPWSDENDGNSGKIPLRAEIELEIPDGYDEAVPTFYGYPEDSSGNACFEDEIDKSGTHNVSCNLELPPDSSTGAVDWEYNLEVCVKDSTKENSPICENTENKSFSVTNNSLEIDSEISELEGNDTVIEETSIDFSVFMQHNPAISGLQEEDFSGIDTSLLHKKPGESFENVEQLSSPLNPYNETVETSLEDLDTGTHEIKVSELFCFDFVNSENCTEYNSSVYEFEVNITEEDEDVEYNQKLPSDGSTIEYKTSEPVINWTFDLKSNVKGNITYYTSVNDENSFKEEFKVENIGPETEEKEFVFDETLKEGENGDTIYYYSTFVSENNKSYNESIYSFELERIEEEETILELTLLTIAEFFDVSIETAEIILALTLTIAISVYVAAAINTGLAMYISVLSLILFSFVGWIPSELILLLATIAAAVAAFGWVV
ncbi:MAG: hypothetical protein ACOCTT_01020 [archaeon]